MAGWRVGWGGGRVIAQARTLQERLQNPPAPKSQFPRYCKLKPAEVGSAWGAVGGESCLRHHPVGTRHRKVSGTPGCLVCGHAELFQPFPVGLRKDLGCTVSVGQGREPAQRLSRATREQEEPGFGVPGRKARASCFSFHPAIPYNPGTARKSSRAHISNEKADA